MRYRYLCAIVIFSLTLITQASLVAESLHPETFKSIDVQIDSCSRNASNSFYTQYFRDDIERFSFFFAAEVTFDRLQYQLGKVKELEKTAKSAAWELLSQNCNKFADYVSFAANWKWTQYREIKRGMTTRFERVRGIIHQANVVASAQKQVIRINDRANKRIKNVVDHTANRLDKINGRGWHSFWLQTHRFFLALANDYDSEIQRVFEKIQDEQIPNRIQSLKSIIDELISHNSTSAQNHIDTIKEIQRTIATQFKEIQEFQNDAFSKILKDKTIVSIENYSPENESKSKELSHEVQLRRSALDPLYAHYQSLSNTISSIVESSILVGFSLTSPQKQEIKSLERRLNKIATHIKNIQTRIDRRATKIDELNDVIFDSPLNVYGHKR